MTRTTLVCLLLAACEPGRITIREPIEYRADATFGEETAACLEGVATTEAPPFDGIVTAYEATGQESAWVFAQQPAYYKRGTDLQPAAWVAGCERPVVFRWVVAD